MKRVKDALYDFSIELFLRDSCLCSLIFVVKK
jgi:hypothetical protein